MKKILWRTLQIFLGLVALLVAAAFCLPRSYHIERSIPIAAPPERIFALVADLSAWKRWGVWYERDPAMTISYSAATSGVGAWTAWRSKPEGDGRATIIALPAPFSLEYRLEFSGESMVARGGFVVSSVEGGSRVLATITGDLGYNPIGRWFGLFLDGMVGPDFEAGLRNLKRLVESTPP